MQAFVPETMPELKRALQEAWDAILFHDQRHRSAQSELKEALRTIKRVKQVVSNYEGHEAEETVATVRAILWPPDDAA